MTAEAWVANSAKIQIIGPKPSTVSARRAEDEDRQARGERELGDVEDELDRRQLAVEQQHHDRADQAGDDEVHRRRRRAGRRRAAGRRARTSGRCGGSAGGPRSARRRGSPGPAPTTRCGPRDRTRAGRGPAPPAARRRRARSRHSAPRRLLRPTGCATRPSVGTWVAHRRRERKPVALDGWTTEISPAGLTGAAAGCRRSRRSRRTASRARSRACPRMIRARFHASPRARRMLHSARKSSVVPSSVSTLAIRSSDSGPLMSASTRLEDPVDLLVVAELGAVVGRHAVELVPGQHERVREVVVDVGVHPRDRELEGEDHRARRCGRTAAPTPSETHSLRGRRVEGLEVELGEQDVEALHELRLSKPGSSARTESVTWRYIPLKQAMPSGSGRRSRRAAGPPAPGAKNPSRSRSIASSRSTTSSTVRLAGRRLTRSASCGHGFGPGGHGRTLTRSRPRIPSRGPNQRQASLPRRPG